MTRTLNKVILIGRLGADPQMKYTASGVPVTTFSLATNRQWTGKDGEPHEETDWHTIVTWDRLAQICSEHLSTGRLVYIEGRLRTRSWEIDGQVRYKTEIIAGDMLILDSRNGAAEGTRDADSEAALVTAGVSRSAPVAREASGSVRSRVAESDLEAEDLPF